MRETTMDILLRMGIPASVKGLTYICDAVELFDTDPYYPDGKICSLYIPNFSYIWYNFTWRVS